MMDTDITYIKSFHISYNPAIATSLSGMGGYYVRRYGKICILNSSIRVKAAFDVVNNYIYELPDDCLPNWNVSEMTFAFNDTNKTVKYQNVVLQDGKLWLSQPVATNDVIEINVTYIAANIA